MFTIFKKLASRVREEAADQRRVLPWVLIVVTLLALPNLIAAFVPAPNSYGLGLFFHVIGGMLLLCVLGLSVRPLLLALAPVALLVPGAAIYLLFTTTLPSTFTFLALLESDAQELSLFRGRAMLAFMLMPVLLVVCIWIVRKQVPRGFKLGLIARLSVGVASLVPFASDSAFHGTQAACFAEFIRAGATFPFGTLYCAGEAVSTRREVVDRASVMRDLKVKEEMPIGKPDDRQVHIFVIGESARYASFQINGAKRATTPKLCKTPGVLTFSDVCAPAPVTLASVPQIITPSDPGYIRGTTSLPSIPAVFRKAGFKVYWLSTQKKHSLFDTTTSLFSEDANEAQFIGGKFDETATGGLAGAQDWQLLLIMKNILAKKEPRVLIIMHTMGSHGAYYDRYPKELERFPVNLPLARGALNKIMLSDEEREALTNAYDNSVLATDWFLETAIVDLKNQHSSSWLYYIADHGENAGDSPVAPFAHGTITQDVFHVPMFIWMSDEYQASRPSQAAALRSRTNTPLSAMVTFHTVLGMSGLSCERMLESKNVASPEFNPGPRLVSVTKTRALDYDREVIPSLTKRGGWHPMLSLKPITETAQVK